MTHHTSESEVIAGGVRRCGQCSGGSEWFQTHCPIKTLLYVEITLQPIRHTLKGERGWFACLYIRHTLKGDRGWFACLYIRHTLKAREGRERVVACLYIRHTLKGREGREGGCMPIH